MSEVYETIKRGLEDAVNGRATEHMVEYAPVVHGEWIQTEIMDDDGVNDDASQCSVCGYVFDSHYWTNRYFKYCPNCGAKMD